MFARFGTRLDDKTRAILERGKRVREILKQHEQETLSPIEQITVLLAVTEGLFDALPVNKIRMAEQTVRDWVGKQLIGLGHRIHQGEVLDANERTTILNIVQQALDDGEPDGNRA
jgi:F-type H+-transporting ATPase subunit alpha